MDEGQPNEVLRAIEEVKESIGRLFKILEGNGEGGLKTKVAVNENRIKALETARSRWRTLRPVS